MLVLIIGDQTFEGENYTSVVYCLFSVAFSVVGKISSDLLGVKYGVPYGPSVPNVELVGIFVMDLLLVL